MSCNKISKINNSIYIGSCEHPITESDEFKELNIDVIINCAKEIKYTETQQQLYTIENYPICADTSISFLEFMDEANDKIHYYLSNGKRIYIHSVSGESRCVAILIYY